MFCVVTWVNPPGYKGDRVAHIWVLEVAVNFLSCLKTHYESEALYIVFNEKSFAKALLNHNEFQSNLKMAY